MVATWPWTLVKPRTSTPTVDGNRPEHGRFSGGKTTAMPGEERSLEGRPTSPEERATASTGGTPSDEAPGEAELPSHKTTTETGVDYDEGPTTKHHTKWGPTGQTTGGRSRPAKGDFRTTTGRLLDNPTGSDSEAHGVSSDDIEWVGNGTEVPVNHGRKSLRLISGVDSSTPPSAGAHRLKVTPSAEEGNSLAAGDISTSLPSTPNLVWHYGSSAPYSSDPSMLAFPSAAPSDRLSNVRESHSTTILTTPRMEDESAATAPDASPKASREITDETIPRSRWTPIPTEDDSRNTASTTTRPLGEATSLGASLTSATEKTTPPFPSAISVRDAVVYATTPSAETEYAATPLSASQTETPMKSSEAAVLAETAFRSSSSPPPSTPTAPHHLQTTTTEAGESVTESSALATEPPGDTATSSPPPYPGATETLFSTLTTGAIAISYPSRTPEVTEISSRPQPPGTTESSSAPEPSEAKGTSYKSQPPGATETSSQPRTFRPKETSSQPRTPGAAETSSSPPPPGPTETSSQPQSYGTTETSSPPQPPGGKGTSYQIHTHGATEKSSQPQPPATTETSSQPQPPGARGISSPPASALDGEDERSLDATTSAPGDTEATDGRCGREVAPCESVQCRSIAARMLALMDHAADPCEDFYAYACGGMRAEGSEWIAEEAEHLGPLLRIAEMMEKIESSSPISLQKFKEFYNNCLYYEEMVTMDERIEAARNILKGVGEMHFTHEEEPDVGNFTKLLGNLLSYNFSPILDLLLDIDSNSTSKFALKLTVPVHKSPFGYEGGEQATLRGWVQSLCLKKANESPRDGRKEEDFDTRYDEYIDCNNDLSKYLDEMSVALQNLKLFGDMDNTNKTHYLKEIESTLKWELGKEMQKMPSPAEIDLAILEKDFSERTVMELQNKFSRVDWNALISKLINNAVTEDTIVHVYFESYFESIFNAMDLLEERKLNNALMAMFAHELYHGLVLIRNGCSREDYCLMVSSHLMEDVTSALFLRSFHPDHLSAFQSKINTVFHQLISNLISEVTSIPWLKGFSQAEALDKVSKMKVISDGGAAVFLNDTYLDSQFDGYLLNSMYLKSAISLLRRFRKKMYLSYGENPSAPEQIWSHFTVPHSIHGMAIYGLNTIVIPYGMMLRPMVREESPFHFQMAGLGNLISQEIWHHFDKTGIKYGPDGSKDDLFGKDAMDSMRAIGTCLEDQYAGERTQKADGGTTVFYKLSTFVSTNNRLADIGAAHLAYTTMCGNLTVGTEIASLPWSSMVPKQLYFLALAQNFCTKASVYDFAVSIFQDRSFPPFMRINDIAFNSREFSAAFSCPARDDEGPLCEPFTLAPATYVAYESPDAA